MHQTGTRTLFDKLGGRSAVEGLVASFYERVLADPELAPFFEKTDIAAQHRHQRAFLAATLGGPEPWVGKSMRAAHAGRAIRDRHFDRVAVHLHAALVGAGVDAPDVEAILSTAASLRSEIVEE